jgi:subtilase family serine protease
MASVSASDLVVDSISAPASVVQGANFNFSYLVRNAGAATAGFHYAGITVDGEVTETNYDAWNPVASLAAGASRTLTNRIDTAGLAVGEHTLTVEEDYWFNRVGETDEANNATTVTFTVTAPAKPDLVVESISAPASVAQGASFDFSYLVKNAGTATARFHYAGINVDGEVTESNYDAWNPVASLGAGASRTLTNSIDTADLAVGEHTLTIEEDYWFNGVDESDEANNATTITFTVVSGDLVV